MSLRKLWNIEISRQIESVDAPSLVFSLKQKVPQGLAIIPPATPVTVGPSTSFHVLKTFFAG